MATATIVCTIIGTIVSCSPPTAPRPDPVAAARVLASDGTEWRPSGVLRNAFGERVVEGSSPSVAETATSAPVPRPFSIDDPSPNDPPLYPLGLPWYWGLPSLSPYLSSSSYTSTLPIGGGLLEAARPGSPTPAALPCPPPRATSRPGGTGKVARLGAW